MIWKIKHKELDLTAHGQVMGILNTTPDSFSDGGRFEQLAAALAHARKMISQGATILDIGGESSRPGASPVSLDEENKRTIPLVKALRAEWDGFISIDTTKAAIAAAALDAGADIVNDISGFTKDPDMPALCASRDCGIVIMHMRGTPLDMQDAPYYENVFSEVREFFAERLATLGALGIDFRRICFDPGIGFGKTLQHNLVLLANIAQLAPPGCPLMLGVSRKSLLSKLSDFPDLDTTTAVITALARQKGIMLHRVHDVEGNISALRTTEAIANCGISK